MDNIKLEDVLSFLKRFNLRQALSTVSIINFQIPWDPSELAISNNPVFNTIATWINAEFKDIGARRSLQMILAKMARYLLLSEAAVYKNAELHFGDKYFPKAFNLVGQMYDHQAESPLIQAKDIDWWTFRMSQSQFPLQVHPATWLARAYLLFCKIPREQGCYEWLETYLRAAINMTPEDYMATSFCLAKFGPGYFHSFDATGNERIDRLLSQDNLSKYLAIVSCTKKDYVESIRGDQPFVIQPERDIYALEPLISKPIIRFPSDRQGEPDSYVCPINNYLLIKGSIGLFYLLNDYIRENEGNDASLQYRQKFGDQVLSRYVGMQLEQCTHENIRVHSIDVEFKDYQGKKPDYALVLDDTVVLVEVKLRLLSVDARQLGNPEMIVTECEEGQQLHKALVQLRKFENFILSNETSLGTPKQVVKLIVCLDSLYLGTAYILRIVRESLGEELTAGVQICTLMDIEDIGQALFSAQDVVTLLLDKIRDSELFGLPIYIYLRDKLSEAKYEGCVSAVAKDQFLEMLSGNKEMKFTQP